MSTSYRLHNFHILNVFIIQTFLLGYCEGVEFCRSPVHQLTYTQMGSSIYNITSPGYPASAYNTTSNCFIMIKITLPQEGVLSIEHYDMMPADCTFDYTVVSSNHSALLSYRRCPRLTAADSSQLIEVLLRNSVNVTSKVFIQLPPVYEGNKFRVNLKILPLLPMRPKMKNSPFTESLMETPSGYISSHEAFPVLYGPNDKNYLELADIPEGTSKIVIEFVYFNLGNQDTCSLANLKDRLVIFALTNAVKDQWYLCSDTDSPDSPITLNFIDDSTSSLVFEFKTDNIGLRRGFLLKYSLMSTINTSTLSSLQPKTTSSESRSSAGVAGVTSIPDEYLASTEVVPPTSFFSNPSNIVAVTAVVLILVLIINVVVCVVYRRRADQNRKNSNSKKSKMAGADNYEEVSDGKPREKNSVYETPENEGSDDAHLYFSLDHQCTDSKFGNHAKSSNRNYISTVSTSGCAEPAEYVNTSTEKGDKNVNSQADHPESYNSEYIEILPPLDKKDSRRKCEALSEPDSAHLHSSLDVERSVSYSAANGDVNVNHGADANI